MSDNIDFFKLQAVFQILNQIFEAKQILLDELVVQASDPVIYNRRFRMISQLSQYESEIVNKLQEFQTDDPKDLLNLDFIKKEINVICSRSS